MTGIIKISDMKREHEAAISKYKNTFMFVVLSLSDYLMIASVDPLSAISTLFKQFFKIK